MGRVCIFAIAFAYQSRMGSHLLNFQTSFRVRTAMLDLLNHLQYDRVCHKGDQNLYRLILADTPLNKNAKKMSIHFACTRNQDDDHCNWVAAPATNSFQNKSQSAGA